jgi:hypothetical protein
VNQVVISQRSYHKSAIKYLQIPVNQVNHLFFLGSMHIYLCFLMVFPMVFVLSRCHGHNGFTGFTSRLHGFTRRRLRRSRCLSIYCRDKS